MLTQAIANEIVSQTMTRLHRNINIMDDRGTIIASGDLKRINQAHFGAIEVLRTGEPLIIKENERMYWEGAKPGINLPIQFQNEIIGVIGITGKPEEIMEFGELVKMITEMIIQQAFITKQLEWRQHLTEVIFDELITSPLKNEFITQKLHLIEGNLTSPYQVALIDIVLKHLKKSDLYSLLNEIFNRKQTLIGFFSVNRLFILSSTKNETKFIEKLKKMSRILKTKGISARIGLGSQVLEYIHIKHSYEEAVSALKVSKKDQAFVAYTEIEIHALLDQLNERAKQQFSHRVLKNLSDKLLNTLEQFTLHNLNIGECAKSMYIHRNSLIYRIKQIKEKTGYDPQCFQDALTLQLAIWIRKLAEKQ